jgi:transposase
VIITARQVEVFAYAEPVDMRKSFDTLSALVKEGLKHDLLGGSLFLFVAKDRKRAKVLYFDGTGLCLFAKRLEKGRFAPVFDRMRSPSVKMTVTELSQFIEGSDAIGKSPPLLTWADLTPRWPEKKSTGLMNP